MENPPAFARWLHSYHIILTPQHHEIHHTSPFAQHYCITCGWLNEMLDRTKFFERLEAIIFRLTGAKAGDYDLKEIEERYNKMLKEYTED